MTKFRRQIAGVLALLLLLTSGAMAAARGQTHDAAGSVIICTGQGVVAVAVDANGQPVGPRHICPDCAPAMMDTPLAAAGSEWFALQKSVSLVVPPEMLRRGSPLVLGYGARAPPV